MRLNTVLTVSQLARQCGLSRGTLLYYESIGLLRPAGRTLGNYRRYTEQERDRLSQICAYKNAGLKLADIRALLDRPGSGAVLERRLLELDGEIAALRAHQRAILCLLERGVSLERTDMITKDKWVEIMSAAGFTEADMHRWHREFEKAAPAEHQQFLEFLNLPADQIRSIREWSAKPAQ